MNKEQALQQLQEVGTEQNRKIYTRHGCDIEQYGVSMAHLKKILKPLKNNPSLGKELFFTDNADAIYLSQWIVDINQLTDDDLENRILLSNYYMLLENAIPNIIAKDLDRSLQLIKQWISHEEPRFRQVAYSLYGILIGIYEDNLFDEMDLTYHLDHIKNTIHTEENRVRYTMNNFVISVGTYISALSQYAKEVAHHIGTVDVNMGETSCKVPHAFQYIEKVESMNRVGKKRKL